MSIARCHTICFSPTGGTLKIAGAVAAGTGLPHKLTDITLPEQRAQGAGFSSDSLVIIAVPVYFGRVEKHAAAAMAALQGQGQPAILVVNYGNRQYDDALLELHTLAVHAGFLPVAAGAFISEHSFSTSEWPMAQGRPDEQDMEQAYRFGAEVVTLLKKGMSLLASVPGKTPYKEYPDFHRAPVHHTKKCTLCGLCAALCPVAAIHITGDEVSTRAEECIACQACVKGCPEEARSDSGPGSYETRERLSPLTRERRTPEVFL